MGLGDVSDTTVPKLTLLAPPRDGGAVTTRTFIPVRCHTSIGVLGAASVAASLRVEGGVGADLAKLPAHGDRVRIEHPTGFLDIESSLGTDSAGLRGEGCDLGSAGSCSPRTRATGASPRSPSRDCRPWSSSASRHCAVRSGRLVPAAIKSS